MTKRSIPTVGIIGAGQLARMMIQASISLGIECRILAKSLDDSAALISPNVEIGDPDDPIAIEAFAKKCDVVTLDHELVNAEGLKLAIEAGIPVRPTPETLRYAQDKLYQRNQFATLGLRVPKFKALVDESDLLDFGSDVGWPLVVKSATGGYDGHGVWIVHSKADGQALLEQLWGNGLRVFGEELIDIQMELAVLLARRTTGEIAMYPVVETYQKDGICHEASIPAAISDEIRTSAENVATIIGEHIEVEGIMAVELFLDSEGQLTVNEIATRPHNSGHLTIDGCITSQFENHMRAVMNWPLGSATPIKNSAVMVNILAAGEKNPLGTMSDIQSTDTAIHLYGKIPREGRKIGHVTSIGDDRADVAPRARSIASKLRGDS